MSNNFYYEGCLIEKTSVYDGNQNQIVYFTHTPDNKVTGAKSWSDAKEIINKYYHKEPIVFDGDYPCMEDDMDWVFAQKAYDEMYPEAPIQI